MTDATPIESDSALDVESRAALDESLPRPSVSPGPDLTRLLEQAATCLAGLGPSATAASSRLGGMRDRLAEGRFHLAVLGQFKRGKSTLLNALLGQAVLPTSVIPLTAIPTFIRPGEALGACIHYLDRRAAETVTVRRDEDWTAYLSRFVTGSGNPKNHLGVSQVEVYHPAPILRAGVVLIDTPGIGSTHQHNTETTLNFLTQCDAAVFLVSADPPVTEVELEFLRHVRDRVSRLFFVMNKVDYLGAEEREEAVAFFRRVLASQTETWAAVPIFCVSARLGLRARTQHDDELWRRSGLDAVQRHLVDFLAHEKMRALGEAVAGKAVELLDDQLLQVRLHLRALDLPIAELEARLALFKTKLGEIQRERTVASDLLQGDRKRMRAFLEEQAEALRRQARARLLDIMEFALASSPATRVDEQAARDRLAEVRTDSASLTFFRQRIADFLSPRTDSAALNAETERICPRGP